MAEKASYAKLGFTILLGLAGALCTLVYLGGWSGEDGWVLAETCYDSPVSGLSVGSEVNFRGVKVGEVKSISFVGVDYPEAEEKDRQKIRIVMAFYPNRIVAKPDETHAARLKHLVARGMRATVAANGITGLAKVELNMPKYETPETKLSWTSEYVYIPPAPSLIENFSASAVKLMNHLNKMDLARVASNITEMVESAARTANNIDSLVESSSPRISSALSDLESAARSIAVLAEELKDEPSLVIRGRSYEPLPETSFK